MTTRAEKLFRQHEEAIHRRTDRMFAILMSIQYVAGIVAALFVAPRSWAGSVSSASVHLQTAILLGALVLGPPIALAILMPGRTLTRHVIAICQMLDGALLIHLSGGRIETHFHIFGSLAFLGFYRDWRVLLSASIVVALDHLFRGITWPESIYGVITPSPWRWAEHTAWMVFEGIFLTLASVQSRKEMRDTAERRAHVEQIAVERGKDIHALQQAKKELDEALRSKNEFMSVCGHELKTPLTSLSLQTQIARRAMNAPAPDPERSGIHLKRLIDQTDSQVHRLLRLVQDMLDHSRIQMGKLPISLGDVDVTSLVREVVERYHDQAEVAGSPIYLDGPTGIVAQWDRFRIDQVITNLISNAIKYGEGKPIEVLISGLGDRVRISVKDNGLGIPSEDHGRIFQQFERVARSSHIAGLGLGLYITKSIVERHGGTLDVISEPGAGSLFTVELPLEPASLASGSLTRAPNPGSDAASPAAIRTEMKG